MKPFLLLALLLPSCASLGYKPGCMVVDVSEKRAVIEGKAFPVATSYKGIDGRPESNGTPIGTFKVIGKYKVTSKGLGKSLHLGGRDENGIPQDDREIMVHASRRGWTHGCIGPSPEVMPFVFATLDVGDTVKIMP